MPERVILHADMDAFFASVEQRDQPKLRGRPVAVIGSGGRTVIVTSSYEARAQGVKTGMNIVEARRLCPELIMVQADHKKYTKACNEIVKILYGFSPDLEVYSIDESFLDISGMLNLLGKPLDIGKKLKRALLEGVGLSCSVGIAPNKLMAKLASSSRKPDGLFQIREEDVLNVLERLPVEELWGIGRRTSGILNSLGIYTCSQLAKADSLLLRMRFGIGGEFLKEMACGIDRSSVMPFGSQTKSRSIGHSMTLASDTSSREQILRHILELSELVSRRMRRNSLLAKTVSVVFRYNDFHTFSRQKNMSEAVSATQKIYLTAASIVKKTALDKPVRLLGVSAHGLEEDRDELFLFEDDKRSKKLNQAVDKVNDRFGDGALTYAAILKDGEFDKVISPSWRPFGARRY